MNRQHTVAMNGSDFHNHFVNQSCYTVSFRGSLYSEK